jgi:hypothetical protein
MLTVFLSDFFAQTFLLAKYIRKNLSHYGLDGTGIECQWVGLSAPVQNGPGAIQPSAQWVLCLS